MRFLLVLALAGALVACGKKGPPTPAGPPDQVIWPGTVYPKAQPFPLTPQKPPLL